MSARDDLAIERLWFGMASIGLQDYGHPVSESKTDPIMMLENMYALGVRKFDTAANYGCSEELLASLVRQHKDCVVATKIGSEFYPNRVGSLDNAIRELERSLSLLSKIDTVYLHRSTADVLYDELMFKRLEQYMRSGDISRLGASVYGKSQLISAIEHERIDIIQVAGCILDWSLLRLRPSTVDKKIVCRSVFLQGLLFKDRSEKYCLPDSSVFQERMAVITALSDRLGVNSGQLSLWFVMNVLPEVDVVVGSRSLSSVKRNLAVLEREIDISMFDEILEFGNKSYDFMNPRLWVKK